MNPNKILNESTKDSGWYYSATAKPDRGFHDYERIIEFPRKLTEGEIFCLVSYFDLDKESKTPYHYGGLVGNPFGDKWVWTQPKPNDRVIEHKVYVYKFECSCDSS